MNRNQCLCRIIKIVLCLRKTSSLLYTYWPCEKYFLSHTIWISSVALNGCWHIVLWVIWFPDSNKCPLLDIDSCCSQKIDVGIWHLDNVIHLTWFADYLYCQLNSYRWYTHACTHRHARAWTDTHTHRAPEIYVPGCHGWKVTSCEWYLVLSSVC